MKLILALALGATAQFATPALRGGARRLEALELLGAEESAKVEAEQEAARATALAEAMAQLKEAQDMIMTARVMLGWVTPEDVVGTAEESEDATDSSSAASAAWSSARFRARWTTTLYSSMSSFEGSYLNTFSMRGWAFA